MLFVVSFLLALVSFEVASGVQCPHGFESHMDSCYFFSHGQETWIGAYETCKLFGAMLVEVNDMDEDAYLVSKSASIGQYMWMGLTDKQVEGDWTWETTYNVLTSSDYAGWSPDEPDGSDDENCVLFAGSKGYKWADVECDREEHFICEISDDEGSIFG